MSDPFGIVFEIVSMLNYYDDFEHMTLIHSCHRSYMLDWLIDWFVIWLVDASVARLSRRWLGYSFRSSMSKKNSNRKSRKEVMNEIVSITRHVNPDMNCCGRKCMSNPNETYEFNVQCFDWDHMRRITFLFKNDFVFVLFISINLSCHDANFLYVVLKWNLFSLLDLDSFWMSTT